MPTRNIEPRANNEGSLGTNSTRWASGHFETLYAGGSQVVTQSQTGALAVNTGNLTNVFYPLSTNPSRFINSGDILNRVLYVGPNGSDSAAGTSAAPLATISRAAQLLSGDGEIIVLEGKYTNQSLDLSLYTNLTVSAEKNKYVTIFMGTIVTGFTLFSGNIWRSNLTYSNLPSGIGGNRNYILESGTPGFPIPISEAHPLQKGRSFRMEHALITGLNSGNVVSSSGVSSGAALWANSGGFIYLSAASGTPSGKTYLLPNLNTTGCFLYASSTVAPNTRVKLNGVKVIGGYNGVDITNVYSYELNNCSFIGCFNAGVSATNVGLGIEKYCEYAGNNNDGMAGQTTIISTGERSRFEIYHPWVHDNGDEGHNGHNNCDMVYYGGLFEYNANGGLTCALGCKTTAYGPHTRRNVLGVATVVDEAGINGNGTEAFIYNLVSEGDTYGYYAEISSGQAYSKLYSPSFISVPNAVTSVSAGTVTTVYNPSFVNVTTKSLPINGGTIILTGDNTDAWDTSFKKFSYNAQTTGANVTQMIYMTDFIGSGNYPANGWIEMQFYLQNTVYAFTPLKFVTTRVSPFFSVDFQLALSPGSQAVNLISNRGFNMFVDAGRPFLIYHTSVAKQGFISNGNQIMYGPTPPATSTSSATSGEISLGNGFIYVATGTNLWGRVALSTF